MNFYITKDNPDGTKERIQEITDTREEALEAFLAVIQAQSHEYHVAKTLKQWRVIKLFDESNRQLAQES